MTKKTTKGTGTHAASFRISNEQYQGFLDLLASVPGSDVGNMYREIFDRGLRSLQAFYSKQGLIAADALSEERRA